MVDAFYAVHTLVALVLASTAVPTYLIARSLGLGRLAANLAAALSDRGAPGCSWRRDHDRGRRLSGVRVGDARASYTYDGSDPAPAATCWRWRGLGLACFARTQFVFLGPVLLASVLIHDLRMSLEQPAAVQPWRGTRGGSPADARRPLASCGRSRPSLLGGIIAVQSNSSSTSLLGNYEVVGQGNLLPPGTVAAGLRAARHHGGRGRHRCPSALTAAWMFATLWRPRDPSSPRRRCPAAPHRTRVRGLVAGSLSAAVPGRGFSTDLYVFELVPLLCVGTVAWVVDEEARSWRAALVAALTLWLLVGRQPA